MASVHLFFEPLDVGSCDAWLFRVNVRWERGEDRAKVKKFVLDAAKRSDESVESFCIFSRRRTHLVHEAFSRDSDKRIQFVNRTVGIDTWIVFGYTLSADERGIAAVPFLRVDPIDRDAWFVERAVARRSGGVLWLGLVGHGRRVVGRSPGVVKTCRMFRAQVDVGRNAMESADPCE